MYRDFWGWRCAFWGCLPLIKPYTCCVEAARKNEKISSICSARKCCCVSCSVYEYELLPPGEGPSAESPQVCFTGICACYEAASCGGAGWHLLAVVPAVLCGPGGEPTSEMHPWGFQPQAAAVSALSGGLARSYRPSGHRGSGCAVMLQIDVSAQNSSLCTLPAKPASFRNFVHHGDRDGRDFQTA